MTADLDTRVPRLKKNRRQILRPLDPRPRLMLRIGIDLGGTKTEGAVMDADGKILFRERRPTPAAQGYEAILNNIHDIVRHLEAQADSARCPVGIGTPGTVSTRTGTLKIPTLSASSANRSATTWRSRSTAGAHRQRRQLLRTLGGARRRR